MFAMMMVMLMHIAAAANGWSVAKYFSILTFQAFVLAKYTQRKTKHLFKFYLRECLCMSVGLYVCMRKSVLNLLLIVYCA